MKRLKLRSRAIFVIAAVTMTSLAPACAQQMMCVLERGPVGFVHGRILRQDVGNLTAGDFAHPAVADWDGDGREDLVVGSGYGDLLLFTRSVSGPFATPQSLLPANDQPLGAVARRFQVSPWLGDLNGDGGVDLLLGLRDRVYRYAVRDGNATEGVLLADAVTTTQLEPPLAPCAADLTADGKAEVIVIDGRGRAYMLDEGVARPIMVAGAQLQVAPPARAWAGDWDGDGRADLVLGTGDARVVLCRGMTHGFAPPEELAGASGAVVAGAAPWVTDFDHDGDLDLLVGGRAGFVALVERKADGTLTPVGYLQQRDAPIDAGRCAVATAGDWDGDGDTDVLVGGEDGTVHLFERLDGHELLFARGRVVADDRGPVVAPGAEGRRYAAPALTDWDTDGDLDLLVGGAAGEVHLWRNTRGLHAVGPLKVGKADLRLAGITMPAAFDYNGDGDMDLFVGARPLPEHDMPQGVVLPRIVPGCVYFENTVNRTGALPRFVKGVPIAMTLYSPELNLHRDAGFLTPYALYPTHWRGALQVDFITVTLQGTFLFTNLARSGAYARLQAECHGRALPPSLLPPLYSAVPAEIDGEPGLLAADCAWGFVCWYPRTALEG